MRIDDLDHYRTIPGAAEAILITLDRHGFQWDGPVLYQSSQSEFYSRALTQLTNQGDLYPCICSRKAIAALENGNHYPGTCRYNTIDPLSPHAIRIKTPSQPITFEDGIQGIFRQSLSRSCGDFIVHRRDGIIAYHLAVVIDDDHQKITEVIRGIDILDSTPKQIFLQQRLGLSTPHYQHIPIIIDRNGNKLSKQTNAAPVDNSKPSATLIQLLNLLNLDPPGDLNNSTPPIILDWAIENWDSSKLCGHRQIYA